MDKDKANTFEIITAGKFVPISFAEFPCSCDARLDCRNKRRNDGLDRENSTRNLRRFEQFDIGQGGKYLLANIIIP